MSAFHGLHNPERHKPFTDQWAECLPERGGCLSECGDGAPCRCCLAAEVERLTTRIDAVEAAMEEHDWIEFDLIREALRGES